MQYFAGAVFLLALASQSVQVMADLHSSAVCVSGRQIGHPGGTPFSPGMGGFPKTYEILLDATECACGYYRRRNTGNKQWDQCPDCTFDGLECKSEGWHIGGDEMNHYCTKYCGAQGSEAD
ncbi:unnamed protein product [Cercospora beticola]|nr:unnamed protein product [Cercospora beticola]